ncbi:MAG: GNAT family N-acetyltransferase [Janthinobacterium lividum]
MPISFTSARLTITEFDMMDADDLFACISPAITVFMPWEPPLSVDALKAQRRESLVSKRADDFWFVIRTRDTAECLGSASLTDASAPTPEVGIWLKHAVHGRGYAGECIKRLCEWTGERFEPRGFIYPVAVDNLPSRRIAERLGGVVIAHRSNPKYASVVYRIPRQP